MLVAPVALMSRASRTLSGGMSPTTDPRGRCPVTVITSPVSSSLSSSAGAAVPFAGAAAGTTASFAGAATGAGVTASTGVELGAAATCATAGHAAMAVDNKSNERTVEFTGNSLLKGRPWRLSAAPEPEMTPCNRFDQRE